MKASSKTLTLVVCGVVVAIAAMYLFKWLESDSEPVVNTYTFLWEKVIVTTIAFFSFIFGFIEPKSSWRWPLLIAYVHYFSGFFIMDHWGQIPPLELIYITLLALPGVAMGYLASKFANKLNSART